MVLISGTGSENTLEFALPMLAMEITMKRGVSVVILPQTGLMHEVPRMNEYSASVNQGQTSDMI